MELTWYGHASWGVEVGTTSLLIDPFFENPQTSMEPSEIDDPDFVVLTHGHADHIGHVGEFTDATVVATPELATFVESEMGVSDSVGMNLGGTFEAGDAYLTMHRADHTNGANTGYEYELGVSTGFLVSDERPGRDGSGTSFYHTGDTGLMSEMRESIGAYLDPDAAAVPIGDHFTMGPWQAAIATEWLGVEHAFPMHYDTFPVIEQDPRDFASEVEGTSSDAEVHVLDGDESFEL